MSLASFLPPREPEDSRSQMDEDEEDEEDVDVGNDVFGLDGANDKGEEQNKKRKVGGGSGLGGQGSGGMSAAPEVLALDTTHSSALLRPSDTQMHINLPHSSLSLPPVGPSNPYKTQKTLPLQNSLTGHVEEQSFSDKDFDSQQRSFAVLGYARNPSVLGDADRGILSNGGGREVVGNVHEAWRRGNEIWQESGRGVSKEVQRNTKRKRKNKGTLGVIEHSDDDDEGQEEEVEIEEDVEVRGEDGSTHMTKVKKMVKQKRKKTKTNAEMEYLGPWAGWEDQKVGEEINPTEEEWEEQERKSTLPVGSQTRKAKKAKAEEERGKKEVGFGEEKSVFHGKSTHDYLGRTYLDPPQDVGINFNSEPGEQECFIPKRCVHTWSGHTKGVCCVRPFPGTGHLLLSGSMDTRIKLWDVYREGKCLRTFMGHSRFVKDVCFSNDGRQFLSAGFDRQMKLWDTETGQCLKAFSNGKLPHVIKFHPDPAKQNVFLAGMSDKKIIQYDINSGEITQEYDQHLGPVNTITFVDESRRFITTSDDKTIRAWDYDIPVVIKYIAEPSMHSMPAVTAHPSQKWLAFQSLDNQILIYSTSESFRQNRKKRFAGHTVSGYACEIGFAPDGRWVSSGDGDGNLVFWDWKTCRLVTKLKCHKNVVISHCWLPHETSKIVTASWDGNICLWD